MTEAVRSRSGLDMPEGSANADTVSETKLIDTNADSARAELVPDNEGGGVQNVGVEPALGEQATSSSPGVDAPAPDATDAPGTTTDPSTPGTPSEGTTPASQPSTDQPTTTPSNTPDQPGDTQPDGSTVTPSETEGSDVSP